jgi:hypothetical protein
LCWFLFASAFDGTVLVCFCFSTWFYNMFVFASACDAI